jgi:glycosyltransferase involved in cell wall biosynthesis
MKDHKIKVYHLIKSLGRGGAEMLLPEGIRFGDRSRFDYRIGYFLPWKDAMVPVIEALGIEVHCFGARNNFQILLAARRVAAELRRWNVDLLHCHLPIAGVVGRIAGRLAGVPVVYTEHNLQERYHISTRRLNRLTWTMQDRVFAVSEEVRGSIEENIGSRVPVQVVLNGVDVDRFRRDPTAGAELRRQLGLPSSAPVVGTVAVFRVQKGLNDWVEAAKLIATRVPETQFILVGDGPLRDEVRESVKRAGLEGKVHMPGLQEDVRPYLSAMDVYMMSSIFEGLPVALLEAMSMECVPVCTAVGGIPEAVDDHQSGLLVPPHRPSRLGEAVCEVLADDSAGRRYGGAARDSVSRRFSLQRMTAELESSYVRVLEEWPNSVRVENPVRIA